MRHFENKHVFNENIENKPKMNIFDVGTFRKYCICYHMIKSSYTYFSGLISRISFLLTWIDGTFANRSPMFTIGMFICATDITAFLAIYQHIILIYVTHVTYQIFYWPGLIVHSPIEAQNAQSWCSSLQSDGGCRPPSPSGPPQYKALICA